MSAPEVPAQTEARQIIDAVEGVQVRLDLLTDAINGLGQNVQWIIDNVSGIFQMFSNPALMAQMQGMMGGMASAQGPGNDGPGEPGDGNPGA